MLLTKECGSTLIVLVATITVISLDRITLLLLSYMKHHKYKSI